jgi:type II secretory pathway component PulC
VKGSQLRLLVALGNLGLIVAIGFLAFTIVRGASFSPLETPDPKFDAIKYQIADTSGPRSSIQEYAIIWQALDRKPKPKPRPAPVKPPPPRPTVQSIASRIKVVAIHQDDDPKKSTAIVETNGQQQMLKYGEKLQGFEVVGIRAEGKTAILTFKGPTGKPEDVRLAK